MWCLVLGAVVSAVPGVVLLLDHLLIVIWSLFFLPVRETSAEVGQSRGRTVGTILLKHLLILVNINFNIY